MDGWIDGWMDGSERRRIERQNENITYMAPSKERSDINGFSWTATIYTNYRLLFPVNSTFDMESSIFIE